MGILDFIVSFPEDYRAMVEDMVKRAIGDCTPYIQSVKRISETSANVNIKFTNVVHNTGYSPIIKHSTGMRKPVEFVFRGIILIYDSYRKMGK